MPYLATRLSVVRAETFHWNQGRTPAEYIAKKLCLLRMANITDEDDIIEELHRGLVGAPSLHQHLDKYVTEGGNSVSEYRRAVGRLQDSARREGCCYGRTAEVGVVWKLEDLIRKRERERERERERVLCDCLKT